MLTRKELLENIDKKLGSGLLLGKVYQDQLADFIQDQIMQYCKPECMLCYDKSYSTQIFGESSTGHDGKPTIHILYCSCRRGQELKHLIEQNYNLNT